MPPPRVLIVEADSTVVADLQEKLRKLGHQIAGIAKDPAEAVRLCEEELPEIVLMNTAIASDRKVVERIRRTNAAVVWMESAIQFAADGERSQARTAVLLHPIDAYELKLSLDLALTVRSRNLAKRRSADPPEGGGVQ